MKLLLILLLTFTSSVSAQTDTSRTIWQTLGDDLTKSGEKTLSFFSLPANGSLIDYGYAAAGAGAILGLMSQDAQFSPWIGRHFSGIVNVIPDHPIWRYYGDAPYVAAGVGFTYILGLTTGDKKLRKIGRLCAESLLFSAIVTTSGKVLFGRARPDAKLVHDGTGCPTVSVWDFTLWELEDSRHSFPSGHSTVAFAISSVLAEEVDNTYFDIGIYTLASLTAISRVVDKRHWFSDVVAGAAIGTLTGIWVTHNDVSEKSGKAELKLMPRLNGIGLQYQF